MVMVAEEDSFLVIVLTTGDAINTRNLWQQDFGLDQGANLVTN